MPTKGNTPKSVVVVFDLDQEIKEISKGEEAEGKLHKQYVEDKLMSSVLAGDKKTLEHAELIQEATNRSVGAFTPDMMFSSLTQSYSMAKQLYGERMIQLLTGYDPNYIEKNLKIPEFRKELKKALQENIQELKDDKIVDNEGIITAKGIELGSLGLVHELDKYLAKDKQGDKTSKKPSHYGERADVKPYRKGDRYKDINVRKTISRAIRRSRKTIHADDLVTSTRQSIGHISLVLALDASASMKGSKLETSKKAGIALSYTALNKGDHVGLVVFGSEIKAALPPTKDFTTLLQTISSIKASRQTDFPAMISKAIELFDQGNETKHLIIITDAMPTVGKEPEKETLRSVSAARAAGITVSIIGIKLEKEGLLLAKNITRLGEGKLSVVRNLTELGHFVLEDYYAFK